MPDEAVTFGGIVRHSSGSRIVTAGHIKSSATPSLKPVSSSVTTKQRFTSLPVPDVVGSRIVGSDGCATGFPWK